MMRRLTSFTNVTLNGYYAGPNGDLSWARQDPGDTEWNEFVAGNASGRGTLLLGRITYDMMASFWPTPMAAQSMPVVAKRMNEMPKIVFSRTIDKAAWQNARLIKDDLVAEVRRLKSQAGDGMAILGSGSILAQLAQAGLIDEFQIVVHPIVLGEGKVLFGGINNLISLRPTQTRLFINGNVLLSYAPA